MRAAGVDPDTLRRLASYESQTPVLSLYLDLDPSTFALPEARSTAIHSLVDEAHRRVEAHEGLSAENRKRGLEAVERVREWLERPAFSPSGAAALGMFCAFDGGLFEIVKLPRPIPNEVVIGRKPFVEPLVDMASDGGWCVLLIDRQGARIFRGSPDRLDEVVTVGESPQDDRAEARGRPQREHSPDEHADEHVKRTAAILYRRFKRAPFERLVIGARREFAPMVAERLHPDMRSRSVGRIDIDVEHASAEEVLGSARPLMEEQERRAEQEAFARLDERMPDGLAVSGLDGVLAALTERRVETLILEDGFVAVGALCPRCGWLGPGSARSCPADGTETEQREDVADLVIARALGQSAALLVPQERERIRELGGIAATLRF